MNPRPAAAAPTSEPPPPYPVAYAPPAAGMHDLYESGPPYATYAVGWQGGAAAPAAAPLRVTHVGPCMLRGGAETWLQGLVRFLDPARVRVVRCLVTDPGLIDPRVSAEIGVPVEVGGREAVRQASRDSDVLLCWGPGELADWLGDCRPPLAVFVAHGEGAWTRYVVGRCAPVLDHVIGVSRWVSERLGTPLPLTFIPNGVDAARLCPTRPRAAVRAALGFGPEDFVLGYVGRFVKEKRPHLLVEVVARLPPPFKALFVGWGELRARVMELANERIPGRYAFTTAGADVGDYYAALDALCLTSVEEGHGLVVLEAMMCGRPVIGAPVGCVPEVIEDRVNGLVARDGADSFAAAAQLLYRRPDWARGLAAEGRAFALEHGHARAMARRYEELLLRLWREKQAV